MATNYWLGKAGNRPQIDKITVAGTWVAGETVTIRIGYADLQVKLGTGQTATATVATVIVNAINARTIDENKQGAETRFNAGQLIGEFNDVEAVVDPANSSIVLVRSKVPGVPFYAAGGTILAASTDSASGTVTEASVQTATSKWHIDNDDNWSDGKPVDEDLVVLRNTDVSIKYGFYDVEVTIEQHQSFTGWLGLPVINTDNPGMPYVEYRQRHLAVDDGGSGTTFTHKFGIGDGPGSQVINMKHDGTSVTINAIVFNTGQPLVTGQRALNLTLNNNATAGTVTVLKGSVNLSGGQFDEQTRFATLNVVDGDVLLADHTNNVTIVQSGGLLTLSQNFSASAVTLTVFGGTCIAQDVNSGSFTSALVQNGTLIYNSTVTITALTLGTAGVFDAEKDIRAFTISACDMFQGASLFDEYARATYTAGVDLNRCGIDDVAIRVGNNRRLTIGTAA